MRKLLLTVLLLVALGGATGTTAQAHIFKSKTEWTNYKHSKYVCVKGTGKVRTWHCKALKWIHLPQPPTPVFSASYWAGIQIYYATLIGRSAIKDPWPKCPDPIFGGGSWYDTVKCENSGNWYDSPGYYRCGLQFDPMWEKHYGRKFCP